MQERYKELYNKPKKTNDEKLEYHSLYYYDIYGEYRPRKKQNSKAERNRQELITKLWKETGWFIEPEKWPYKKIEDEFIIDEKIIELQNEEPDPAFNEN